MAGGVWVGVWSREFGHLKRDNVYIIYSITSVGSVVLKEKLIFLEFVFKYTFEKDVFIKKGYPS